MTGSAAEGTDAAENAIPVPEDIVFGDESVRGFLFANVLPREHDGEIHFDMHITEA